MFTGVPLCALHLEPKCNFTVITVHAAKIISLPERNDRRRALTENLLATGILEGIPIEIITPKQPSNPTSNWNHGLGAWSCLLTHLEIIENIRPESGPTLILEDDCYFAENSKQELNRFLQNVPDDWGQVYLGGRHTDLRQHAGNEVFKGSRIVSTHAYLVNPTACRMIGDFIRDHSALPIDEVFAEAHSSGRWNAYCPDVWFAGQSAGFSDIAQKFREAR